jgi:Tfp pilus assembly protein FimV
MTRLLVLPVALALAGCLTQAPAPSVDRSPTAQSRATVTPPAAVAAPSGPGWYTVKRGETLYRIARFPDAGRHTVELELIDGGVEFYAATFGE